MTTSEEDGLELQFFDSRQPERATVAAVALAQSLVALQRLVHLVAMRAEGRIPGRRIRPSIEIQQRYRLVCDVPQEGSYIAPVRLEGEADLLSPEARVKVMKETSDLLSAFGNGDEDHLLEVVADQTWRRFYLEALDGLHPPPGTKVELKIVQQGKVLIDTQSSRSFVSRLSRQSDRRAARGSVIGELKRIDFAKQEITIRHLTTSQDLTCLYEAHVEDALLAHPRDLVVVFGTVTRDATGRPTSIEDVDHIEPADLNAEPIVSISLVRTSVSPKVPLSAEVTFDEDDAVYLASIDELDVRVFAERRSGLAEALADELSLLWRRYALADDDRLTPAARRLKTKMHDYFNEQADA